jgi:hypothetical protein
MLDGRALGISAGAKSAAALIFSTCRSATIVSAPAVGRMVSHKVRVALLTATIILGVPALASAQDQVNPAEADSATVTQFDQETQSLATMRQQIPQDTITPVAIRWLDHAQRGVILSELSPLRAAALRHALSNAMVATEDRPNGASEDQVSLADYLTSIGIDPAKVVGVTIATNVNRANPPVTVYYRGRQTT